MKNCTLSTLLLSLLSLLLLGNMAKAQCPACNKKTINAVLNGDFELGNLLYSSQYNYSPNLNTTGNYFVGINANLQNVNFKGKDHTTGNSNFLMVNGGSTAGVKVWTQTVVVLPNTVYNFAAWFTSLNPSNPARLQFNVNGVNVGPVFSPSGTQFVWKEFNSNWNSGANTTAVISIVNQSTLATGNDFGIDDLSFSSCLPLTVVKKAFAGFDTTVCGKFEGFIGDLDLENFNYSWAPVTGMVDNYISSPYVELENTGITPLKINYILTADTLGLGCIQKDTITITVNPLPKISLGPDTSLCTGPYLIDANVIADLFTWNTGSTDAKLSVSQSGIYTLTASLGPCGLDKSVSITLDTIPSFDLPDILSYCMGTDTILQSTSIGIWNTGEVSNKLINPSAGMHILTVGNGTCSFSDSTAVEIVDFPAISLDPLYKICAGETALIGASSDIVGSTFEWSNASSSDTISAQQEGWYQLRVKNKACESKDSTFLKVIEFPLIDMPSQITLCQGQDSTIGLSAIGGLAYSWSTGATTAAIDVSQAGTYQLTVSNDICSVSKTVNVVVNEYPVLNLNDSIKICQGETVNLNSVYNPTYNYRWNTNDTLANISINSTGMYLLKVSNGQCASYDSTYVNVLALPVNDLPAQLSTCQGDSVLAASTYNSAYNYIWSNGKVGASQFLQNSGNYELTVSNDICSKKASVQVNINPVPQIVLPNSASFCENFIYKLKASNSAYTQIIWNDGDTSNLRSFSSSGSYQVTVSNGPCSSSKNISIIIDQVPQFDLLANLNLCQGSDSLVSAISTQSYSWIWNTGETSASKLFNNAGNYTLSAINGTCSVSKNMVVKVWSMPVANLPEVINSCENEVVNIQSASNPNFSYAWNTGATTSGISASNAGLYSLIVKHGACTSYDSTLLVTSTLPVFSLIDSVSVCDGASIAIGVNSSNPYQYTWSNGETSQTTTIYQTGWQKVRVKNGACSLMDSCLVQLLLTPKVKLPNDKRICENDSLWIENLLPEAATNYQWNNGINSDGQYLKTAGTYILTANNGICSARDSFQLGIDLMPVSILSDTIAFCENSNIQIAASNTNGASTFWFNGQTAQTYSPTSSGVIWAIVSKGLCELRDSAYVRKDLMPQEVLANNIRFCESTDTLVGVNVKSGYAYLWSNGVKSAKTKIATTGTYTLKISNGTCVKNDTTRVTVDKQPTIALPPVLEICEGQSAELGVNSKAGESYAWNNGANTAKIVTTIAGLYHLSINNGTCWAHDSTQLDVLTMPIADLSDSIRFCENDSLMVRSKNNNSYTYNWSNGFNGNAQYLTKSGSYTLNISNKMCSITDTITVRTDEMPISDLPDRLHFCQIDTAHLSVSNSKQFEIYWWNGVLSDKNYTTTPGNYWLKMSNGLCNLSDTVTVIADNFPIVEMVQQVNICKGDSALLNLGNNSNYSYSWENNSGAAIWVNNAKEYLYQVINGSCVRDGSVRVNLLQVPKLELGANLSLCADSVQIGLPIAEDNVSYLWNDNSSNAYKWVKSSGEYKIKAQLGNCFAYDSIRVEIKPMPIIVLPADTTLCENQILMLYSKDMALWNNDIQSKVFAVSKAGTYQATVFNGICASSDEITVSYTLLPRLDIADLDLCEGSELMLTALDTNYSYEWLRGKLSDNNTITTPGEYTLVAKNSCGTDTTHFAVLPYNCGYNLHIPNAFTPDGDGINDVFKVVQTDLKEVKLIVSDRWGNIMYEGNGDEKGWDGIAANTGKEAKLDAYIYEVSAIYDNPTKKQFARIFKKGQISLFK